MPIRNLIFDLGGVLYAIDNMRSYAAFKELLPPAERSSFPDDPHKVVQHPIFLDFETGKVNPAEFRQHFRDTFHIKASDAEIDQAWNALLLGVIPGRVEDMIRLKKDFRLFLLSNTNRIHAEHFQNQVVELFVNFERCYLSFEMGMRKPDHEIYEEVVHTEQLDPAETLFIDDTGINLTNAAQVGLKTFHLQDIPKFDWMGLLSRICE